MHLHPKAPRLSRWLRLLIGAITLWPFLYLPGFIVFVLSQMESMAQLESMGGTGTMDPAGWLMAFGVVFVLHLLTILSVLATTVGFAVHAATDSRMDTAHRVIWLVLLLTLGILAAPVYWYLRVRREELPAAGPQPMPAVSRSSSKS